MSYQERALKIIDRLTDSKAINIRERGTLRRAILLPEIQIPQGEWVKVCDIKSWQFTNEHYECDRCHYKGNKTNFCPNCGADMKGGVE